MTQLAEILPEVAFLNLVLLNRCISNRYPNHGLLNKNISYTVCVGMPIPWRFSFLGDSGNRGMAICHSSGIGETKTFSPGFGFGVRGNFGAYFISDLKLI